MSIFGYRSNKTINSVQVDTDSIEVKIDVIDSNVDAIKIKTDSLPNDPADQSAIDAKLDLIDSNIDVIKSKTDNLPANTGTILNTILAEAVEIEHHFHNHECWFGVAASPVAGVNESDEYGLTTFRIDSGNNNWGTAVCVLGTSDTPCREGNTKFDFHRILVTATERAAEPYLIRVAWGETEAAALTAGDYTTIGIYPTATIRSAPYEIKCPRISAGTRAWVNCKCANNTGTINFLFATHEYLV